MTGLAARVLTGEILDRLAPDDPRAVAARRDLRRINALMLQPAIMARLLRAHAPAPPRKVLEIGAGDGRFMLSVARRLARHWPGVELTMLDLSDLVSAQTRAAFAALGWTVRVETGDVLAWTDGAAGERYDVLSANLFLHHFDAAALRRLFAALAPLGPAFVAAEPHRDALSLAASRMLWAIGANDVTRHDAPASVRAGFRPGELSSLWPGRVLLDGRRGPFTLAFAARPGS